jgi:hypothetical protein
MPTESTARRKPLPMLDALIARELRRAGIKYDVWTQTALSNWWGPLAEHGLDDRWPRLAELRERFHAAYGEVEATKAKAGEAQRALDSINAVREEAAKQSVDVELPSRRDAEEKLDDARQLQEGARVRLARTAIEVYAEARELAATTWREGTNAAIAEAEEVKRRAEEELRQAEHLLSSATVATDLLTQLADGRRLRLFTQDLERRMEQSDAPDERIAMYEHMVGGSDDPNANDRLVWDAGPAGPAAPVEIP